MAVLPDIRVTASQQVEYDTKIDLAGSRAHYYKLVWWKEPVDITESEDLIVNTVSILIDISTYTNTTLRHDNEERKEN